MKDQTKLKKGKMRVVKLTILLTLCFYKGFTQTTADLGNQYRYTLPGGEGVSNIYFDTLHHYYRIDNEGMGQKKISKGYYLICFDTLILFNEPIVDPDTSYYTIEVDNSWNSNINDKSIEESKINLATFKIKNERATPLEGITIVAKSSGMVVSGKTTNEDGEVTLEIQNNIDTLCLFGLEYKNLSIPAHSFKKKDIIINVTLKKSNIRYNPNVFIQKFIISKQKHRIISFRNLSGESNVFSIER